MMSIEWTWIEFLMPRQRRENHLIICFIRSRFNYLTRVFFLFHFFFVLLEGFFGSLRFYAQLLTDYWMRQWGMNKITIGQSVNQRLLLLIIFPFVFEVKWINLWFDSLVLYSIYKNPNESICQRECRWFLMEKKRFNVTMKMNYITLLIWYDDIRLFY